MTTAVEPNALLEDMLQIGQQILGCTEVGIDLVLALWAQRTRLFEDLTKETDSEPSILSRTLTAEEAAIHSLHFSTSDTRALMQAVLDQNIVLDTHMNSLKEGLRQRLSVTQRRLSFEQTYRGKDMSAPTARMFDERK